MSAICPCCGKPKKPKIPQGLGTALKPAAEFVALLRKPLSESTVASNVLKWGCGALNIDAGRVEATDGPRAAWAGTNQRDDGWGMRGYDPSQTTTQGRWPPNLAHDGSEEVMEAFAAFGERDSGGPGRGGVYPEQDGGWLGGRRTVSAPQDTGTAARFFFCGKAQSGERVTSELEDAIIEWADKRVELIVCVDTSPPRVIDVYSSEGGADAKSWNTFLFGNSITDLFRTATSCTTSMKTNSITGLKTWNWLIRLLTSVCMVDVSSAMMDGGSHAVNAVNFITSLTITVGETASLPGAERVMSGTPLRISVRERQHAGHPTVKPIALMEWLVKLVCPPNGRILDPFCGTGSTLVACDWLGIDATGIEEDPKTCADAEAKIKRLRARRLLGKVERVAPLPGQGSLFG